MELEGPAYTWTKSVAAGAVMLSAALGIAGGRWTAPMS